MMLDVAAMRRYRTTTYAYVYETIVSGGEPSRLGTRTYFEVGFTIENMLEF